MISAIVLAAGRSVRMGQPKLLLPIGGQSLVRIVVGNALRSRAGEVIVVLGNEAALVRREVELALADLGASCDVGADRRVGPPLEDARLDVEDSRARDPDSFTEGSGDLRIGPPAEHELVDHPGLRLIVLENPRFAQGQSTSLKAGLSAIDERSEGVLVLMGDQPFVGPDIIDALIERAGVTGAPLVMPQYVQGRASPALFARALLPELMEVSGDKGGRDVIARYLDRAAIVDVPSSLAGLDIDTWDEYQELSGHLKP